MYRDYIFDLYGTLVDIRTDEDRPELWKTLASEYEKEGICANPLLLKKEYHELVKKAVLATQTQNKREYEAEIQLDPVFAALFHRKDVQPDSSLVQEFGRRFREASLQYLYAYQGARDMLLRLRAAGGRVWLLSNAQRIFTAAELERLGLAECFDGIYLSSDYGCKKPDPLFFQKLLTEQKINPQTAIMVGNDGFCDIRGAKSVDLHTLYIHSATSPKGDCAEAEYSLAEPDMKRITEILLQSSPRCPS